MLSNEKYKGDFHLQKYYTPPMQWNVTRRNRGEVQNYCISENHKPIVLPELWGQVQKMREYRKKERNIGQDGTKKFQNRYPLSGKLICPFCRKRSAGGRFITRKFNGCVVLTLKKEKRHLCG